MVLYHADHPSQGGQVWRLVIPLLMISAHRHMMHGKFLYIRYAVYIFEGAMNADKSYKATQQREPIMYTTHQSIMVVLALISSLLGIAWEKQWQIMSITVTVICLDDPIGPLTPRDQRHSWIFVAQQFLDHIRVLLLPFNCEIRVQKGPVKMPMQLHGPLQ